MWDLPFKYILALCPVPQDFSHSKTPYLLTVQFHIFHILKKCDFYSFCTYVIYYFGYTKVMLGKDKVIYSDNDV